MLSPQSSGVIHKKVGVFQCGIRIAECGISSKPKAPAYAEASAGRPAYANLLRQGYGGQEASAGRPAYANLLRQGYGGQEASAGRQSSNEDRNA